MNPNGESVAAQGSKRIAGLRFPVLRSWQPKRRRKLANKLANILPFGADVRNIERRYMIVQELNRDEINT